MRGVRTASCVYRRLRGCASPQRANSGIWQGIWEGSCSSIDSRSPGQNSLDHGPWAGHGERKGVGFVGDCRRLWNVPGARSRHPGSAPEGGRDVGEPPRDGRQRRLGCPRSLCARDATRPPPESFRGPSCGSPGASREPPGTHPRIVVAGRGGGHRKA